MSSKRCKVCDKAVYHAERAVGCDDFHKRCLKCRTCNKLLDSTTLAMHEGVPYCKSCHSKQFGACGYGYGAGGSGPMGSTIGKAPAQAPTGPDTFDGTPRICGPDECPRCGKKVYAAERVLSGGKEFHKSCFRCFECGKRLDSTTVTNHEGGIYCKACHGKKFGPKGYGFGQGAGALPYTE